MLKTEAPTESSSEESKKQETMEIKQQFETSLTKFEALKLGYKEGKDALEECKPYILSLKLLFVDMQGSEEWYLASDKFYKEVSLAFDYYCYKYGSGGVRKDIIEAKKIGMKILDIRKVYNSDGSYTYEEFAIPFVPMLAIGFMTKNKNNAEFARAYPEEYKLFDILRKKNDYFACAQYNYGNKEKKWPDCYTATEVLENRNGIVDFWLQQKKNKRKLWRTHGNNQHLVNKEQPSAPSPALVVHKKVQVRKTTFVMQVPHPQQRNSIEEITIHGKQFILLCVKRPQQ